MTNNLVHWLERLMTNFGAGWVMWLLIGLSIISVAIMLERAYFYWRLRDDIGGLAHELRALLRKNDIDGAIKRMQASPSAEAAVVVAGLLEADRGAKSAEEAMQGAAAPQEVMAAIAEALIATAIGLLVAIPAVAMFNLFMRMSKSILANTEALTRVLLSHLTAEGAGEAAGEEE